MITQNTQGLSLGFPLSGGFTAGLGNTRLDSQNALAVGVPDFGQDLPLKIGLDYLRIVWPFPTKDCIAPFLDFIFNDNSWTIDNRPYSAGRGAKKYDMAIDTLGCGRGGILFYPETDNQNPCVDTDFIGEISIDLTGEFLQSFDLIYQHDLLVKLYQMGARCTRLDIALDDFSHKIIPLDAMNQAFLDNLQVGFFQSDKHISREWIPVKPSDEIIEKFLQQFVFSDDLINTIKSLIYQYFEALEYSEKNRKNLYSMLRCLQLPKKICSKINNYFQKLPRKLKIDETTYFGSRQSSRFVRCYYHDFKECKSLRYEVEFKRERASELLPLLAEINVSPDNLVSAFQATLTMYAVGAIDFKESKKDKNLTRCKQAEFWKNFINIVSSGLAVKVPLINQQRTVEKSIKWIKRQVLKTLSSILFSANRWDDFITLLGYNFLEKCTDYHLMLNSQLQRFRKYSPLDSILFDKNFLQYKNQILKVAES